jgi:hypothetical protein
MSYTITYIGTNSSSNNSNITEYVVVRLYGNHRYTIDD